MVDQTGRTFICSVVFVDLVEYSRKSVAEQILLKETCNALIAEAIDAVPPDARIVLDTGDGAAITFLGDPEDALFVGLKLRDSIEEALISHSIGIGRHKANGHIRVGVNLGPVKIATNVTGGANIVGDGISVAERIMSFALPGQMLVSRSFYEMVSRLSDDYGSLFTRDGQRTDPNGRVHELYLAGQNHPALDTAERGARERKKTTSGGQIPLTVAPLVRGGPGTPRVKSRTDSHPAYAGPASTQPGLAPITATGPQVPMPDAPPAPSASSGLVAFLEDRYKVGFVAVLLTISAVFLGFQVWQKKAGPEPAVVADAGAPGKPVATPDAASTTETKDGKGPAAAVMPPPATTKPAAESKSTAVPDKAVKNEPVASAKAPAVAPSPPAATSAPSAPVRKPEPAVVPSAAKEAPSAVKSASEPAKVPSTSPASASVPGKPAPIAPAERPPDRIVPPAATTPAPKPSPSKDNSRRTDPAPLPTATIPPVAQPQPTPQPSAPPIQVPVEPAPKPAPVMTVRKVAGDAPDFPPEAVRAGVDAGYVRVRVRIDADGAPAGIDVIESRPARVFERAVRNALKTWRFNPGAPDRIYEAQIDFNAKK